MSDYYYGIGVDCEVPAGYPDVRNEVIFKPGIIKCGGKYYEGVVLFKDVESAVAEKAKWDNPKKLERAFIYRIKLTGNIERL
jgi:hypothetical protein